MPKRKPSGVPVKNALARARDAWLEGEEGQRCRQGSASGIYLANRLEAAFIAGWDAAKSDQAEADSDAGRVTA